ncbi:MULTISPECIES: stress response translation initiation inhibitor YciH [unclassified Colwellia]|uniref:stress response translation initiation inhibitor YciH n=1 Tax=unclassified Colwellia TaxID=196834 RepID=UPI0015F4F615|nr:MULTISPECIES: stress response translation initiation inhibitor YciH [unclassified Colwellia]MBA6232005.1 stress response translation initiation inhibitor YciH [Colwellia sp. MB02u-7]MBA6236607.1 stress response translation initiation inhibitor YciH [Colwellia sp. MB02u-11]MBA6254763.1 stress response translation initiation inhibitor YciH [Colwellia sp. MB3u-28]MBA6259273.1 stress response translation initiation inhibitor YciH [Colwellia sp. MB3u-41]MBA6298944.1 stress response translation i
MNNKLSSLSDLASAFGREATTPDNSAKQQPSDTSLVYSTDSGRIKQESATQAITASDGYAKVRRETKGRKGKGVVTITGLGIDAKALKELAKKLKKTCGSGGSVVGDIIEVQGDKREQIKQVLESNGYKVKFIGG